ncbi:MAG: glycine betaine ABC transporter substrate-binding protein [Lysinibacillus sp.]
MNYKKLSMTVAAASAIFLAACNDESSNTDKSLGDQLDYKINGIEPGSGTMGLAHNTLEEYGLDDWKLTESSTASMLIELDEAISREEPIIITGWNPHWMFDKYDLKYLEDPKETFGGVENIHTFVRKGFGQDFPGVYKIVDAFEWTSGDMEKVMSDALTSNFDEASAAWVEQNKDKVEQWTKDVPKGNGEEIKLISTPWESEDASANVMKQILEQHGYTVKITPVDPAIMFQAIATGEGDVSLAPWLPATHASFYEKHKDSFVDLGANLEGARIGLVVPTYMDIDSIEDLK